MSSERLRDLMRHMEWADARVWETALDLPEALADASMRERLHHVHATQWAYLQIWNGEPVDLPELSTFEDLRAIGGWGGECHRRMAGLLDDLDDGALEGLVDIPWSDELVKRWGKACPATLAETILQVVYHSTYHRGQVNTRLRELGGEPPLTDYIIWIWMDRPEPDWVT
jgi:uncharacterized damage-inducible protein DinB